MARDPVRSVSSIPPDAKALAHDAIVAMVDERLLFNERAYGKAWTGEDEDTEFIVGESAEQALSAAAPKLYEAWAEERVDAVAQAMECQGGVPAWPEMAVEVRDCYRREARAALGLEDRT